MSAERKDQRARRAHLSESWNAYQGCLRSPAQTMRAATALHTTRQHSRPDCWHVKVLDTLAGSSGLRVWRTHLSDCWNARRGRSMFRAGTTRVAAALHTVRQHWSGIESCQRCQGREMTSQLGRHTCQMVGVYVKAAQVSQRRP